MYQLKKQQGFTLIELLVVVSILAAMAGIAVSAVGGYEQKARADLAQTEIKRIANAIQKFKKDTGYYPNTGVFSTSQGTEGSENSVKADFSFLFYSPSKGATDTNSPAQEILPWDISAMRGWNGPYLTMDSIDYMRKGGCAQKQYEDDVKAFPKGVNNPQDANAIMAISDTFESRANYNEQTELCFVTRQDKDNALIAKPFSGQPYHYETAFKNNRYPDCSESGAGCIAVISAGKNGVFENGNLDDIVQILRVN